MTTTTDKITFYNAIICPFAQRVAIALKEVGAEYDEVAIDLIDKPEWYTKDINPEGKVPVLDIEGQKVAESLVLVEYINDRFPEANLMPKEPIKRANVRFIIEYFSSKISPSFFKYVSNFEAEGAREAFETEINAALVRIDQLLQKQSATGPYFLGEEFSLADVALAPFILRLHGFNELVLDGYQFDAVKKSSRLQSFIKGATTRPSVQKTYVGDEGYMNLLNKRYNIAFKK